MPNTTNYNWATPADTDLVKDGAAAIRTLGSSADTTVKNLNPGTTAGDIDYYTSSTAKARVAIGTAGQVLRVNSGGNAPEWATTADQTPLTTKGDLFTFTTIDARLGVGANGTVLTADSAETTGLKWATPASASGPAFKARRTADQNVASANTFTKVQLNAEVYDTDNCFDSTTNFRFTPNKAGYYQFNSKMYFPIASNNTNFLALYKNGAVVAQTNAGTNGTSANMGGPPGLSDLQSANGTTDYFEIYAYSTSAGNDIGGGGEQVTYLSGVWIRGL